MTTSVISPATSTEESQEIPIEILDYAPTWPGQFEAERLRLEEALAPWLAGPIEPAMPTDQAPRHSDAKLTQEVST